MIGYGCSLTKRYTAKSAKAQRENGTTNTRQKNDVDRQSGKPIIFQPQLNSLSNKKMQRQAGVIKVPL